MRKPRQKLPRGVHIVGANMLSVSFALADGRICRRVIGPISQFTFEDAERERLTFKKQVADGTYQGVKASPTAKPVYTVADLWAPYITAYKNDEKRGAWRLEICWNHLKPMFESVRVEDVTTALVGEYIASRKADGMSNGTINRELTMLKAMFNLGAKVTPPMVERVPSFPKKLKEAAPRAGFTMDAQYNLLQSTAKEPWLKGLLAVAYTFGFRKGELLSLRVSQVDLLEKRIRLGHNTKTGQPRIVAMTGEVYDLIRVCVRGKNPDDYVFTRADGSRVAEMRDDWYALCVVCKLGTLIPAISKKGKHYKKYVGLKLHDFRRSAVRNMTRAGIPTRVCMDISGHKTMSVFNRYNIVDEQDIVAAAAKIEQARKLAAVTAPETDIKLTSDDYARN